jgi:hypothetical protein
VYTLFFFVHADLYAHFQVFSWEPVRCHDVVDMGWTNMADLSIYEGKLLGCSYHERRVGLWAADISVSIRFCMECAIFFHALTFIF